MSDLVNAQKEFEELIDQLEKLKDVNQLTSTNAQNAERIINEIESFTVKTGLFLDKVNEDHNDIEQKVKSVITALDENIEKFKKVNNETKTLVTQKFSKIDEGLIEINDLHKDTDKSVNKNFSKIEEVLKSIKEEEKRLQRNQAKTEKNVKTKIEGMGDQLSGFKTKTYDELKTIKVVMITTLVIIVAGFITIGLLI